MTLDALSRLYNSTDARPLKHLLEAALTGKTQVEIAIDNARAAVRFYEERRDNAINRWDAFNRTGRVDPDRRLDLIDDLLEANANYLTALNAWADALGRGVAALAAVAGVTAPEAAEQGHA